MQLRLTLPADSDGVRLIRVNGHTVGTSTAAYDHWVASLWPVADQRPAHAVQLHAANLTALREQLAGRLYSHGVWWTVPAPAGADQRDGKAGA